MQIKLSDNKEQNGLCYQLIMWHRVEQLPGSSLLGSKEAAQASCSHLVQLRCPSHSEYWLFSTLSVVSGLVLIICVYISVSGSPNTSNTYLIPVPSLPEVLSLIII